MIYVHISDCWSGAVYFGTDMGIVMGLRFLYFIC